MRKKLLFALLIILNTGYSQIPVVNFTLTDTKGNEHVLYDYLSSNNAVILDFFMTTCGNCADFVPDLQNVYLDYLQNAGALKIISMEVSEASNADIDSWKTQHGATYPAIGGSAAKAYWESYIMPHLGSYVNQLVLIIPVPGYPSMSYIPFFLVGPVDSLEYQELLSNLQGYGYHAGIEPIKGAFRDINLFPNPCPGKLYFDDVSPQDVKEVKIYSLDGSVKAAIAGPLSEPLLDIAFLTGGTYYLIFTARQRTYTGKIILFRQDLSR